MNEVLNINDVHGYLEVGGFPYKKFLKNSSDRVKEYFRNFFKDI